LVTKCIPGYFTVCKISRENLHALLNIKKVVGATVLCSPCSSSIVYSSYSRYGDRINKRKLHLQV